MKQIHAYVKPHKLADITLALHDVPGLTGMTVTDARGFGRSRARSERDRAMDDLVDYVPCVRLEIFCLDALVETIVALIQEKGHTGLRGDGKIYVSDVREAVRIETGERGEAAV